jgi:tetratricopeptide (TPR) repeat protein
MINGKTVQFLDSPRPDRLVGAVNEWQRLVLPERLNTILEKTEEKDLWNRFLCLKEKLKEENYVRARSRFEKPLVEWIYASIRLNIKRGRIYKLTEVLDTGKADCLGYAKLFTVLGRCCGLDLGVVEVITDIRGMNVPHTVTLVRLTEGRRQIVDFWYGSTNIQHKRLGLNVKRGNKWQIEDIDYESIKEAEDISYLPDYAANAITLYVEGNRYLKAGDYAGSLKQYTRAIQIYPVNARVFYNRAIAYEYLGYPEKAREDYARALLDESSTSRTLATQPEDIEDLIRLDEEKIPELEQQVFLLHQGFVTGRKLVPSKIARRLKLTPEKIKDILDAINKLR